MELKVLYISYDGLTDPLGQSQILPYLEGLSENKVLFHLISFEKKERFHELKELIQSRCNKSGIIWHPLSYTKKPPLISTIIDLRKMQKTAIRLQREIKFDIVHCRSDLPALTGRKLQKKFGVKFVFDMRGFWADERIEGKIWNYDNPVFKRAYRFFKQKETEFFTNSDAIISLTENGRETILNMEEIKNKNVFIEVIPCCVDLKKFDPDKIKSEERLEIRKKLGINSDDFVLGYIGSIGTWYMLEEMLDFYKTRVAQQQPSKFIFLTAEKPELILEKSKEKDIAPENLIIKRVQHSEIPFYASLFDYSIFFIRPTFSKKASSPTKQGELMSLGIPIVCNSGVGDTDEIVKKYEAGEIIEDFNVESYSKISLDPARYDKAKIRTGAHEVYSLEQGIKKYLGVYKKIMG